MTKQRRITKSEWLSRALDILESSGIDAVRIEELARQLGVAKSGFYWHFKDRADLLRQMLNFWVDEYTSVVTANRALKDQPPQKRLENLMRVIRDYELNRLEAAMVVWAGADPDVQKVLDDVYQKRLAFVRSLFSEMGFTASDLEMRTYLLLGYMTSEHALCRHMSDAKWNKLLKLRMALLTK